MNDWRKTLLRVLEWVDPRIDRLKTFFKAAPGLAGQGGYGALRRAPARSSNLRLKGRVLEERNIRLPRKDDPAWRNFRSMVRRFLSAEVPGARVRARFGGETKVSVANDEGFFDVFLEPKSPPDEDRLWHPVELELLWPMAEDQKKSRATGRILVPPDSAGFAVISDIDDTVVRTEATSLLRMLRLTLFSNAYTRLPFEGVAAFYRSLHRGGSGEDENPIFYVSTGPWNLYDLLEDFLKLQEIPVGPIFLKDWGRAQGRAAGHEPPTAQGRGDPGHPGRLPEPPVRPHR